MDNPGFVIGMFLGFWAGCATVIVASALYRAGKAAQAVEAIDLPQLINEAREQLPGPADMALREANHDAQRLAGALESGLRSGWPFNFLITRALAQHYARIGRKEVERSSRLN